jgi:hypothetical protein
MRKTQKKELSVWVIFGKVTCGVVAGLLVLVLLFYIFLCLARYGRVVPPFATKNEIVKEAVMPDDFESLEGKQYIICTWTLTTGYNYIILQDENGNTPDDPYCWVSGPRPDSELPYTFMICHNTYILYYSDKIPYDFDNGQTHEYIVTGWDVLYPVKHPNPLMMAPNHIVKVIMNRFLIV